MSDRSAEMFNSTMENGVHEVVEEEKFTEESEAYTQRFLESVSQQTGSTEERFGEEAVFYEIKNDGNILVTYGNQSISLYGDEKTVEQSMDVLTAESPAPEYWKKRASVEAESTSKAIKNFSGLFKD